MRCNAQTSDAPRQLPDAQPTKALAMSLYHAVAFVDHYAADVLQFGAQHVVEHTLHQQLKFTRAHHSGVRTEHVFFGQICDALDGITEVLVTGGHTALADFRHYVDKHRPQTAARIAGYEVVDHPTEKQLVALARKYFAKHDQFVGIRLPT
jgi:hypothetical protein